MKIKNIKAYLKDLGTSRPYTIAYKTISEVFNVIVELELENGIIGYGTSNPSPYVVQDDVQSALNTLETTDLDFLIGKDIRHFYKLLKDIHALLPQSTGARTALDIAMHDAFAKYLDVPLVQFLGQEIKSLPTSVTIGIKNVEETIYEAQEYHDMGFRYLKVKTGNDVEEDIARIKKLREQFGNSFTIRVDANQGYDVQMLDQFFQSTKADQVELIEQPFESEAIDELKMLSDEVKSAIAADESLVSPLDAFNLADSPVACGIFNIKLMKSGGILPAQEIATIAKASGIDLMWGCNDESAVSISAALHTALSYPHTKYLDLDGSLDLLEDVVQGGFEIKEGWMSVNGQSGLGVEPV